MKVWKRLFKAGSSRHLILYVPSHNSKSYSSVLLTSINLELVGSLWYLNTSRTWNNGRKYLIYNYFISFKSSSPLKLIFRKIAVLDVFWPHLASFRWRIGLKRPKGTSTWQDLSFEPITTVEKINSIIISYQHQIIVIRKWWTK